MSSQEGSTFRSAIALLFVLIQCLTSIGASEAPFSDVLRCCNEAGLSNHCAENLCQPVKNLTHFFAYVAYYLVDNCSISQLNVAALCLSDGRNHSKCCHRTANFHPMKCDHLCTGQPLTASVKGSDDYTLCLLLNFQQTMLGCIAQGRGTIPGPPVSVRAQQVGAQRAILSWSVPKKLPEAVKSYLLRYYDDSTDSDPQHEVHMAFTSNTRLEVFNLRPNGRYKFHVVSIGLHGDSLRSEEGLFTTGATAPTIEAYQKTIKAPLSGSATLVCRLTVEGLVRRPIKSEWSRAIGQNNFLTLPPNHTKFDANFFSPQFELNHRGNRTFHSYTSTLHVKNLTFTDYGTYKCRIITDFGLTEETIQLVTPSGVIEPPDAPPDLLQCCHQQGVSIQCSPLCNNDPTEMPRFSDLKHPACANEILKIKKCLAGDESWTSGACCLRRRVPSLCLEVCQKGVSSLSAGINLGIAPCLPFRSQIFECLLEGLSGAPDPPRRLAFHTTRHHTSIGTLSWEKSDRADSYFVYYRKIEPQLSDVWHRLHVTSVRTSLENLQPNEIYKAVVLASNSFGFSDSSRSLKISL